MLINSKIELKFSGWRRKDFWKPGAILYIGTDGQDPRLGFEPGWFRSRNGRLFKVRSAERREYRGRHPFTFGFYEAFADADVPMDRPGSRLGHAVITLEARNLSWKKPSEFGRMIRKLSPGGGDRFPDRPFECYLLDEDDRMAFDQRRAGSLEKLVNGPKDPAPEDYLHITVSFDSWVNYTRDIPYTSVNELAEVEAVMREQLDSVVRADCARLDDYFGSGRFPVRFQELPRIFA